MNFWQKGKGMPRRGMLFVAIISPANWGKKWEGMNQGTLSPASAYGNNDSWLRRMRVQHSKWIGAFRKDRPERRGDGGPANTNWSSVLLLDVPSFLTKVSYRAKSFLNLGFTIQLHHRYAIALPIPVYCHANQITEAYHFLRPTLL